MKVLYFAWLRERIGHAEEEIVPPQAVTTIGQLTDFLASSSAAHARAFAERQGIKVARDQQVASFDTPLGDAREIAFFPPFTGG